MMAVLNVPYLDFFMLTSVDEHLERIDFDRELWQQALPRLFSFFRNCIVPEMFSKRLLKQLLAKEIIIEIIDRVVLVTSSNQRLEKCVRPKGGRRGGFCYSFVFPMMPPVNFWKMGETRKMKSL